MPNILIVEDNEGIRVLLNKKLKKMNENMAIHLLDNGNDALNYLNDHTPDLILLDYVLPDIQAEQVIEHLNSINKRIPFIIFTGQGNEKIAVELMKMGAIDYVVKDDLFWEFIIPSIDRALNKIATEQQLYQAQSELKESEVRLKQVINLVPHFIYAKNMNGHIILANTAFMVAMGVSTLEELNLEIERHRFLSFSKDDKEVIQKEIMKLMYDETFTDFTGEEKSLQTSKIPFTIHGSQEKAILAVSIDVTAQKLVEEKIKELNVDLEKRVIERTKELEDKNVLLNKINKAQDDILGIVAHDLRQPLTIIMTTMELLKMTGGFTDKDSNLLDKVEKACLKMNTLIKDLLDISMLESENFSLDLKNHNLNEIMLEVIGNFQPQFASKNISFNYATENEEISLPLNLDRFWQIISNLVSNALKFTETNGHVNINILGNSNNSSSIRIEIKDDGIGMSEDRLNVLFEKFTKAGRMGTTGEKSTGLGMSITKRLVELHKGHIDVVSTVDHGTTVKLDFPIS